MGKWSVAELNDAFLHLRRVTDRCFASDPRDLSDWYQCYTEDVVWHDLGFGFNNGWDQEIRGLGAVRAWMHSHNAVPPQDSMKYYPVPWYIVDAERGWAVCEWRNRMLDPGTGEVFEEKAYSHLIYGGNRQWRYEADIYNPLRMRTMMAHWLRAREKAAANDIPLPPLDMNWGLHLVDSEEEVPRRWSREELEAAFDAYVNACLRARSGRRPEEQAAQFTEDVVYRELGFGFDQGWKEELRGRTAVTNWLSGLATIYPNRHMRPFEVNWRVIDPERGWVVYESLDQMEDPGNGEVLQMRTFSRMKYAGSNQWRFKEDIYDPMKMRAMLARWRELHQQHQTGRR